MKLKLLIWALCVKIVLAQSPVPGTIAGLAPPFVAVSNAGTDVLCGLHADTITGITCGNLVTDATAETAFATTTTIPAGTLTTGVTIPVNLAFGYVSSGSASGVTIKIRLGGINGALIYTGTGGFGSSSKNLAYGLNCNITAGAVASTTTPIITTCASLSPTSQTTNAALSTSALSIPVNTTISQAITVTATFSANTAGNALWLYSISSGRWA